MRFSPRIFGVSDFLLRSFRPYIWIALIASLPYLQILTLSEYTHYDDYYLIVESFSHINKLHQISHAFLEDVSHQAQGGNLYRPIMTISLMLSAQISGTMPFGYHLIDILLHCASSCLLFVTLQTLGFKRSTSFIGTIVFCIHPALTQTVAWIPGRNDSLLALFILLCFISFQKYISTSYLKWYFIHLFFFALALFTKETSILFPVLAMLYFYNLKGKEFFSITTVLFIIGWSVILFNWHVLRSAAMISPIGDKFQAATLVLSNLWIAIYYYGKLFWPFNLAFAPVSSDVHVAIGIISTVVISFALFLSEWKNWRLIVFGAAWFIVFLVPTFYYDLTVQLPPKFYEHRIYLPSMGILFILLSLSFSNLSRFFKQSIPYVIILIVCVLGWYSYSHTFVFRNSLTLSEYDAATSPNDPRRYNDITRMDIPKKLNHEISVIKGVSQQQDSKQKVISKEELWKIIDGLKVELASNRNDPELHHALAVAYFARGLFLSSEENFLTAIRRDPKDAMIPYNLGIMYYTAHVAIKAERAWQETLRIDTTMGYAHLNLSYLYFESGQYRSAWDHCQKAFQLGIAVHPGLVNEIQRKLFK